MSKLKPNLTPSPNHNPIWLWGFLVVAFFAYTLPWLTLQGWSLGAYDLAEWISLYLPQRPLETALYLRLPPVFLAFIMGIAFKRFSLAWIVAAIGVLTITVGLLPPLTYFIDSSLRSDVNYAQQFYLAIATLIGGSLALSGIFYRQRLYFIALFIVAIGIVSITGLTQAQGILDQLQQPHQLGIGVQLLIVSLIIACVKMATSLLKPLRREA